MNTDSDTPLHSQIDRIVRRAYYCGLTQGRREAAERRNDPFDRMASDASYLMIGLIAGLICAYIFFL